MEIFTVWRYRDILFTSRGLSLAAGFFSRLPGWALAVIGCILLWFVRIAVLKIMKRRSKLHGLDADLYSSLFLYFHLTAGLLVFSLFYGWMTALFAIMLLGSVIITAMKLKNFSYLRGLAEDIEKGRFHTSPMPCVAYLPQPLMHREQTVKDFVQELSSLDHHSDDFKYLVVCAPYSSLESLHKASGQSKSLLWNLDLLLIDQNDASDPEARGQYSSFAEKVIKAVESPRTCVASIERSKEHRDTGMTAGGVLHTGSALEPVVISRIRPGKGIGSSVTDDVKQYIIDTFLPVFRLNKRLFDLLSPEQFGCLDRMLSRDAAPAAGLLLRLLRSSGITERFYLLMNLCEAKARYYAALALSLSKELAPEVYEDLKEPVLMAPSFGMWVNAIRDFSDNIIKIFKGEAGRDEMNHDVYPDSDTQLELIEGLAGIREFFEKWCLSIEKTDRIDEALREMSEIIKIENINKAKIRPVDFYLNIVRLRNKTSGHGSVTFNVAESLTNTLLAAILDIENAVCRELDGELLWRSGKRIYSYSGAASIIYKKFIPADSRTMALKENMLYYRHKGYHICIQPWLYRDVKLSRLMFFNGSRPGGRMEYLSYESGSIIEPDVVTVIGEAHDEVV